MLEKTWVKTTIIICKTLVHTPIKYSGLTTGRQQQTNNNGFFVLRKSIFLLGVSLEYQKQNTLSLPNCKHILCKVFYIFFYLATGLYETAEILTMATEVISIFSRLARTSTKFIMT